MRRRLPVFHIGSNHAASTTLQRALFARHPDVLSLGRPSYEPEVAQAVAAIVAHCHRGKAGPQPDMESLQRQWRRAVSLAAPDGQIPVFSREGLILRHLYEEPDAARLPQAIMAMTGGVRIVIVARNQLKLIESLYAHKTKINHLPLEEWFASQPERFAFGHRFHEIADIWAGVVGEENVGVFLFEELAADSASFARRLCAFMGIDAERGATLLAGQHYNKRRTERRNAYVKLRGALPLGVSFGRFLPGRLRRSWRNYLESGSAVRVAIPDHWRRRLEEYYRTDNRKLATRFRLPLDAYGYPL
jgi:hypothetical protein